jgi:hypothetical protein
MGVPYRIVFESHEQVKDDEGNAAYGTTSHDSERIQVCDNLSHHKERDTLLHELLHQMLGLAHVELPDGVEERVCTFLGTALTGHMQDNHEFWAYITEQPKP